MIGGPAEEIIQSQAPQYGKTPRALLRDGSISARAKALYALLDDYADVDGKAFPSRTTIGAALGCSSDSVDRAVSELEKAGWVCREVRRKEDKSYRATLYTLRWTPAGVAAPAPTGVAAPVRPGSRTGAERVAAPVPTEEEPQEEEPQKEDMLTADAMSGGQWLDAQFEIWWKSYPRKVSKRASQQAYRRALTRMTGSLSAKVAILRASAERLAADPNLPTEKLIPHASTWLNGDRWLDGPYPPAEDKKPTRNEGEAYTGPARQVTADEWDQIGRNSNG